MNPTLYTGVRWAYSIPRLKIGLIHILMLPAESDLAVECTPRSLTRRYDEYRGVMHTAEFLNNLKILVKSKPY